MKSLNKPGWIPRGSLQRSLHSRWLIGLKSMTWHSRRTGAKEPKACSTSPRRTPIAAPLLTPAMSIVQVVVEVVATTSTVTTVPATTTLAATTAAAVTPAAAIVVVIVVVGVAVVDRGAISGRRGRRSRVLLGRGTTGG
jgi:hypothetical protein